MGKKPMRVGSRPVIVGAGRLTFTSATNSLGCLFSGDRKEFIKGTTDAERCLDIYSRAQGVSWK